MKYNKDKVESNRQKDIYLVKLREQIYDTNDFDIDKITEEVRQENKKIDTWTQTLIQVALHDKAKKKEEVQRIIAKYIEEHPKDIQHIKILKQIQQRAQSKRRLFDKFIYDKHIGWNKKMELKPTIYEMMHPELQEKINAIISIRGENDETIQKIKKYMNCDSEQKNARMKLILEIEKLGINISKYYPTEYGEYQRIRQDIIKEKKKKMLKKEEDKPRQN